MQLTTTSKKTQKYINSRLPVGVAIQNNKPAKSLSGGSRITYIVSPRKVYEVTGHVWRGKEALKKKNKTDEHIEE